MTFASISGSPTGWVFPESFLSCARTSASTLLTACVTITRPACSANPRRGGWVSNSSTEGSSRRRAAGSFCIFAAGSTEGLIAKLFEHNAIQPRNQRDFPLRQSANRQSLRLGPQASTLESHLSYIRHGHNRRRSQSNREGH